MIPNNIYYRRIAQLLNHVEYEHFYSTLYYLKRIAQSFGETYTGFNPSNKYLKDWALARGVTDDGEHHINRYWLHKIALTYDNSTLAGKTDNYYLKIIYDNITIGERTGTILTIDRPTITVTDEFDVSGHLEDENGNNLTGLTVKLLCDNVQVATDTTDNDGNVQFHRSAVTTRTNYTFQLVFSGNTDYAGSTSSIETVMPDKETTFLDISSPINDATYYTDEDVLVSGRLIDNDSQAVANKTIYIYDQWNMKDWGTATSDSNGYFSKSLDYDSLFDGRSGTQLNTSLHIFFMGDNEFTRVDQYIDGIVAKPYINLESDKSILSKADDDEAVLTATLYSSDKVGKAVSFDIVDSQGTVLSHIGDGVTNSNGVAVSDHNYESDGVGDIIIKASATVDGILVSKTFVVEDCLKYDGCSSDHTSDYSFAKYVMDASGYNYSQSLSFDSANNDYDVVVGGTYNGGGTYYVIPLITHDPTKTVKITAKTKVTDYVNSNMLGDTGLGLVDVSNNRANHICYRAYGSGNWTRRFTKTTGATSWTHIENISASGDKRNEWITHELTVTGLSFTYKLIDSSNTILWEYSNSFDSNLSGKALGLITGWVGNTIHVKDMKVKPL